MESTCGKSRKSNITMACWNAMVSNAGPDAATNVTVGDLLPGGFTYVSDDGGGA